MRANVTYYVAGESERTRLGEVEIDPPPGATVAVGGTVRLAIGGKTKLGIVEAIEPGPSGSPCCEVTLRLRKPVA
jgi:hypothetical protein